MVTNNIQHRFSEPSESQSPSTLEFVDQHEAFASMVERVYSLLLPVAQAIQAFFERPDVQEALAAGTEMMLQAHDRVAAVDAPGYVPYFERLGYRGTLARLHVLMIRSCADRFYREDQDRRIALSALHDLAQRSRWHPALARQVDRLLETCWSADFIKEACRDAGCPELADAFMDLLFSASKGDDADGRKLIAITKRIGPYAPSPRGRRTAFDTVLHQTFLRWSAEFGGRRAYTYGLVQGDADDAIEDYTDEATAATRIELNRPSFNPSSARRAERKRVAKEAADESVVGRP